MGDLVRVVVAVALAGIAFGAAVLFWWCAGLIEKRSQRCWSERRRALSVFGRIGATVLYLGALLWILLGILWLCLGVVGFVGPMVGWSESESATIAAWAGVAVVVAIVVVVPVVGLWNDYLRHLLPGSLAGEVVVEPGPDEASTHLRKRWRAMERLDPLATAVGAWVVMWASSWDIGETYYLKISFLVVAALGLVLALLPRGWRAIQYRKKTVQRVGDVEQTVSDEQLGDILLPRAMLTPVIVLILCGSVQRIVAEHLPEPIDSVPLATIAAVFLATAMKFPLVMDKSAKLVT